MISHKALYLAATLLCALASARAAALDLIIPWPEGGETDKLISPIAPYLAKHLNAAVTPRNIAGNFGVTGVEEAAKRPADGSALVAVHEYLYSVKRSGKPAIDPLADLSPICGIVYVPSILAAGKSVAGTADPKALLASKKRYTAAWTVGPTSTNFMMLAMLEKASGISITFKDYRSKAAALSALNDGEVDLAEIGPDALLDPANSAIVPVAASAPQRDSRLSAVPTLKEIGLDVNYGVHRGLAAPKATAAAIQTRLEKACQATAAEKALNEELAKLGARSVFLSGADYSRVLARMRDLYASGIGPRN